jgi:hypothetical protein
MDVVASLDGQSRRAVDTAVGAGELVEYMLRATDGDGLQSEVGTPIAVSSRDYELESSLLPDGVELRWNAREDEGWTRALIYSQGALGPTEIGSVTGGRFVHTDVKPGSRYRYRVVLERSDGRRAPQSRVAQVDVPAR